MHVLFVHKNFPAQFGHIASHLVKHLGWRATFISETTPGMVSGIQKIQYKYKEADGKQIHYCSRPFESNTRQAAGIYEALKALRYSLKPDLIVGHSGLGPTVFLHDLFPDAKVINYFEYFYRTTGSDLDFRKEWAINEYDILRAKARNAMLLLDLEYCAAGYAPTKFQRDRFPEAYRGKIRALHDGIPTDIWRRHEGLERALGKLKIDADTRIVTYCSRGMESMRGFDIFMRTAKKIYEAYPKVVFLIAGSDKVCYGGDLKYIQEKTFKEYVLKQDKYDPKRLLFLDRVPPSVLVRMFNISDLHIYLTVPFVLSWSMLDAMACGAVVLGSKTAPIEEFITDGENGLLADFYDVDGLAKKAVEVLKDPAAHRHLGENAMKMIQDHYSVDAILPQMVKFYQDVAGGKTGKAVTA